MKLTKNPSLLIGVSIPILMVIFVGASIYLPGLFISPETDFLYLVGNGNRYNCLDEYLVSGKTLTKIVRTREPLNENPIQSVCVTPIFYVYDASTNDNREVTFDEARALTLDSSRVSPDGFEVVRGSGGGGFLFFDGNRNYNSVYLRGRNVSRKIALNNSLGAYYDYYDFQFLGWILPSSSL